jgi:rhodanese-related sulfurtransferase
MVKDRQRNIKTPVIVVIMIIVVLAGTAYVLLEPAKNTETGDDQTESFETKHINTTASMNLIDENNNNPEFVILDVRTPEEFSSGHIENATMLDFYEPTFSDDLDQLDKSKTYFVYCRSGNRSGQATDIMMDLGFQDVYNMLGGINHWNDSGYPTVNS